MLQRTPGVTFNQPIHPARSGHYVNAATGAGVAAPTPEHLPQPAFKALRAVITGSLEPVRSQVNYTEVSTTLQQLRQQRAAPSPRGGRGGRSRELFPRRVHRGAGDVGPAVQAPQKSWRSASLSFSSPSSRAD